MTATLPWLTDDEIADLCEPLKRADAQTRYLEDLGLTVKHKPNGRPLVIRAHAMAVLSGLPPSAANDTPAPGEPPATGRAQLIEIFGRRRQA